MRIDVILVAIKIVARALCCTLLGVALHGCATMSQEECELADWYLIGFEDGAKGRSASYIGERRGACADYRVKPDRKAYILGREQGLREFCRPQKGYRLGVRGSHYQGFCPKDLEEKFMSAYLAGKDVYYLESTYRSTQQRLHRKNSALTKLKQDLNQKELDLVSGDTSTIRRIQLLAEIHELAEHHDVLETEIAQLEIEGAEQHNRLVRLKQRSIY